MTANEVPTAGGPVGLRAFWVLLGDTWHQAWREPMIQVELGLLLALSIVSGVAAIGSPTAGDGAIQMWAVCLALVPFALVLAAGQVWRHPETELALQGRPIDAWQYTAGRGAGLVVVGLVMLAATCLVGSIALAVLAGLPFGRSLVWDLAFSALGVAPSVVLVAGATVLWATLTQGGARYYPVAILGSLVVAFLHYKAAALVTLFGGGAALFLPFPALLTLGLALPPTLLPATPGWLVPNRVLWLAVGVGCAALAAALRGRSLAMAPAPARVVGLVGAAAAVAVAAAVATLAAGFSWWVPPVLAPSTLQTVARRQALVRPGLPLRVDLTVSPTGSAIGGSATLLGRSFIARSEHGLWFWLNSGLTVTAATVNGVPRPVSAVDGDAVAPGTAARLWEVPGPIPAGASITLQYYGTLAPPETWLPAPPFERGIAYEGAYLDPTHLLLQGSGTWYPAVLASGANGRPVFERAQLTLALEGALPPAALAVPLVHGFQATVPAGPLPAVLWLAGPYIVSRDAGVPVYSAHPLVASTRAALALYAVALRRVGPLLPPVSEGPWRIVRSPLSTTALLTRGALVSPENQPFCIPPDPETTACVGPRPTPLTALLRVAAAGWANALGSEAATPPSLSPVYAAGDARNQLVAPLAVATAWGAARGSLRARLQAAWQRDASLPVVGRLSPAARAEAKAVATFLAQATPGAWRRWTQAVEQAARRPRLTWAAIQPPFGGSS